MSFIDNLLAGAIQVETAKANNPRYVTTAIQQQSQPRTSVDNASAAAAASVPSPGILAGVDKRILYATGAVIAGLFLFSMVRK